MSELDFNSLPDKIIVEHVSKHFRTDNRSMQVLEDISLTVKVSEFVCLLGPSGCGKTTLLNLIAGFEFPECGKIFVDGKIVKEPGSDRMVMFQESALFPWLDTMGNILFSLSLNRSLTPAERKDKADYFIRLVGLEKFAHAFPHELSGGMKQRAALARALAPGPQVLLMDEPFAALDALTREQLYEDLQLIRMNQEITIVFVTHNVAEAACLGDRILLFSSNPGKIYKEFLVKLERPRDIRDLKVAQIAGEVTHHLRTYF